MIATSAQMMRNTSILTRKMRGDDSLDGSISRAMVKSLGPKLDCQYGTEAAKGNARRARGRSAFVSGLDGAQELAVDRLVAGDDVALGQHGVVAVEIADEAAGLAHHQDTGRHVPGGEVAFPIAVEPASGDPGKVEGCGAEPAQSRDLLLDRRKLVAELREPAAAVMRQPTGDHRVGEVPPCGDAQPPIVEERTLAALAGIKLVGRRIVDHARDDRAFALEPDRDRELRNPVEEIGRAVERIDDPGVGFVAALPAAALLAQESVAGPRLRQFHVQDLLGPTVGRGDEIARPLQRDLEGLEFAETA